MITAQELNDQLKTLLQKDLRIQCRARGLNPGGSREALLERLRDHMLETGNMTLVKEYNGEVAHGVPQQATAGHADEEGAIGIKNNNYTRAEGQNVGNFITDRRSSRVLAPPGGTTNWSIADAAPQDTIRAKGASSPVKQNLMAPVPEQLDAAVDNGADDEELIGAANVGVSRHNNYSRPEGQNVGNFITAKPSSRVLAPPGGSSSIVLG